MSQEDVNESINLLEKVDEGKFIVKNKDAGSGGNGVVFFIQEKNFPEMKFAVKVQNIINKSNNKICDQEANKCKEEANSMRILKHKNVVSIKDDFILGCYHFIQMKKCKCSLDDWAIKNSKEITQEQFYIFVNQILDGVEHIHRMDYVLRDLKLGNILIDQKGNLKFCDFGSIKKKQYQAELDKVKSAASTCYGTVYYLPPEILQFVNQGIFKVVQTKKCDIWAIGVCLSILGKANMLEFQNCNNKDWKIPKAPLLTQKCQELVNFILQKDPKKRPTIGQIRQKIQAQPAIQLVIQPNQVVPLEIVNINVQPKQIIVVNNVDDKVQSFNLEEFYQDYFKQMDMTDIIQQSTSCFESLSVVDQIQIINYGGAGLGVFLVILSIVIWSFNNNISRSVILGVQIILMLADQHLKISDKQFNVILTLIMIWFEFYTIIATNMDDGYNAALYAVYWTFRQIYHGYLLFKRYQVSSETLEYPQKIQLIVGLVQFFNLIVARYSANTNLKAFTFTQLMLYQIYFFVFATTKMEQPLQTPRMRLIMQIIQQVSCLFPFLAFSCDLSSAADYILAFQLILYEVIFNVIFQITSYENKVQESKMNEGLCAFIEQITDCLPTILPLVMQQSPKSVFERCIGIISMTALKKLIYIVLSLLYCHQKNSQGKVILQIRICTMVVYKIIAFSIICSILQESVDDSFNVGRNYSIAYIIIEVLITITISLAIFYYKRQQNLS